MVKKSKAVARAERDRIRDMRFAAVYFSNGRNATEAYLSLYPRATRGTASVEGSRFLAKPQISDEVLRLETAQMKREQMTPDQTLQQLARIAGYDPSELIGEDGRPLPMKQMPERIRKILKVRRNGDGTIEYETPNRDAALTNLLKVHKLIGADTQVTLQVGFYERLQAARAKRLGK